MSSVVVEIAEAVKDQVNLGNFNPQFVAERLYVPRTDLASTEGFEVYVWPATRELEMQTREEWEHSVTVQISLLKKVRANQPEDVDALLNLVEDVIEWMRGNDIELVDEDDETYKVPLITITSNPIVDRKLLSESHVAHVPLLLTFLTSR